MAITPRMNWQGFDICQRAVFPRTRSFQSMFSSRRRTGSRGIARRAVRRKKSLCIQVLLWQNRLAYKVCGTLKPVLRLPDYLSVSPSGCKGTQCVLCMANNCGLDCGGHCLGVLGFGTARSRCIGYWAVGSWPALVCCLVLLVSEDPSLHLVGANNSICGGPRPQPFP
jgi:hypothetical protein